LERLSHLKKTATLIHRQRSFIAGVYVSAYVSKGAQDAWEKVLDGTYSGFSIGGNIKKYDDMYDDKISKSELSLKNTTFTNYHW
jgi:hypothetical protein